MYIISHKTSHAHGKRKAEGNVDVNVDCLSMRWVSNFPESMLIATRDYCALSYGVFGRQLTARLLGKILIAGYSFLLPWWCILGPMGC